MVRGGLRAASAYAHLCGCETLPLEEQRAAVTLKARYLHKLRHKVAALSVSSKHNPIVRIKSGGESSGKCECAAEIRGQDLFNAHVTQARSCFQGMMAEQKGCVVL